MDGAEGNLDAVGVNQDWTHWIIVVPLTALFLVLVVALAITWIRASRGRDDCEHVRQSHVTIIDDSEPYDWDKPYDWAEGEAHVPRDWVKEWQ